MFLIFLEMLRIRVNGSLSFLASDRALDCRQRMTLIQKSQIKRLYFSIFFFLVGVHMFTPLKDSACSCVVDFDLENFRC